MTQHSFDEIFNRSSWWGGLRLAERLATPVVDTPEVRERGRQRLALWRDAKVFTGGIEVPLERWFTAGLTEERLVLLLGESTEDLRARRPEPPDWLRTLAEAWQRFHDAPPRAWMSDAADPTDHDDDHDHDHGADAHPPKAVDLGLFQLFTPLLEWSVHELSDRLAELAARYGTGGTLPDDHPLFAVPVDKLGQMVVRTLVLELNVARVEGRLPGTDPQERFQSFVASLGDPDVALAILGEYPVLARQLVVTMRRWLSARVEFVERLLADLPALRQTLGLAATGLTDLAEVQFGAGDTHRGGRTVAIVTFADGSKLVYKPRGLAVEDHFNGLLRWLNGRDPRHHLRPLRILDRDTYGWAEFVAAAPCAEEAEVRRFFWRQGAYLAVFYLLRASDLHLENLIAAGEHPVFVDLEATFQSHPEVAEDGPMPLPREAVDVVRNSVLSIGLLPQRMITGGVGDLHDVDLSGLAGSAGQLTPMPVPTWDDAGTDVMRLVRRRLPMPGAQNLARLGDEPVDPLRYRDELARGFEECYALFAGAATELVAPDGPIHPFATDEVRYILRPTMVYGRILHESWHPDLLRDCLERECYFEVLAAGHEGLADRDAIVGSECGQIFDGDVPFFATTPGSRDLVDGAGPVSVGFFPGRGVDAVLARAGALTPADLERQRWCIAAAMTALRLGAAEATWSRELVELSPRPLTVDRAVAAAARLGTGLVDSALVETGRDRPVWLTLNLVADRYWAAGPTALDMYAGVSGIALFLAHLGEHAPTADFRRTAERVAELTADHLDALGRADAATRDMLSIGAFGDLGGAIYLFTHLGALWGDDALFKTAHELVPETARRFADDPYLDIVSGTAGAALAILALHAVQPSERSHDALVQAGDVLLGKAERDDGALAWRTAINPDRPLLGFSHGVSGFAYTLARLAEATGAERFRDAGRAALRYEERFRSTAHNNWPDLRSISPDGAYMDAWCHGAAGIGLARAELVRLLGGSRVLDDLFVAVDGVRADLVHDGAFVGTGNHSICHGDLGLVETVQTAGRVLADPDLVRLAGQCADTVAGEVLAGRDRSGVPFGVATPGLMMGVAGIGYGLLRAALPDRVPNVLLLEPPCAARDAG